MRTVFVNPSRKRRRRRNPESAYENPGKRRRNRRYVRIRHKVYRHPRRNPDMSAMMKETATIALGAVAGSLFNRLGASHITNFYLRNAARLGAAALLTTMRQNPVAGIAAAGALLAPMVPEVEMQMASSHTATKNPGELAAELADLLEADLSDDLEDGDLEDGEVEEGDLF